MGVKEMKRFAEWMHQAINNPSQKNLINIKKQVRELCKKFPPPGFSKTNFHE